MKMLKRCLAIKNLIDNVNNLKVKISMTTHSSYRCCIVPLPPPPINSWPLPPEKKWLYSQVTPSKSLLYTDLPPFFPSGLFIMDHSWQYFAISEMILITLFEGWYRLRSSQSPLEKFRLNLVCIFRKKRGFKIAKCNTPSILQRPFMGTVKLRVFKTLKYLILGILRLGTLIWWETAENVASIVGFLSNGKELLIM